MDPEDRRQSPNRSRAAGLAGRARNAACSIAALSLAAALHSGAAPWLAAWASVVGALATSDAAASTSAAAPVGDHDWARDAVRAGEIRSLAEILKRMEREFHGQVLEIELERDDDRIVYEIELLTPAGHVVELTYDARTGVLLEAEGQGLDRARRQLRI